VAIVEQVVLVVIAAIVLDYLLKVAKMGLFVLIAGYRKLEVVKVAMVLLLLVVLVEKVVIVLDCLVVG